MARNDESTDRPIDTMSSRLDELDLESFGGMASFASGIVFCSFSNWVISCGGGDSAQPTSTTDSCFISSSITGVGVMSSLLPSDEATACFFWKVWTRSSELSVLYDDDPESDEDEKDCARVGAFGAVPGSDIGFMGVCIGGDKDEDIGNKVMGSTGGIKSLFF